MDKITDALRSLPKEAKEQLAMDLALKGYNIEKHLSTLGKYAKKTIARYIALYQENLNYMEPRPLDNTGCKHSPGPWELEDLGSGAEDYRILCGEPDEYGAYLGHQEFTFCLDGLEGAQLEEAIANLRLMSFAPELLEALETAISTLWFWINIAQSEGKPDILIKGSREHAEGLEKLVAQVKSSEWY